MKITPVTPNILQLTRLGFVNCYLVREEDGFTLVDTNLPGWEDEILSVARTHGGEIKRILLTHAHGDHIGSLDKLVAKIGTVDVAISARSIPLLAKDLSLNADEPQAKIRGSLPGAQTRPTHATVDGELYGSLRIIATPGHIPGHCSFLDERDGTLLAGDLLASFGELRIAGDAIWFFPLPNFGTWHIPTAIASARRLTEFPIQRFACGHGPIREGKACLSAAIAHAVKT